MTVDPTVSLLQLRHRLQILERVLAWLCVAWCLSVGLLLADDVTPNDLQHHRAPVTIERLQSCDGEYARRYACAETILLAGEKVGAAQVILRLATTAALPCLAWAVWSWVMRRTELLLWHHLAIGRG